MDLRSQIINTSTTTRKPKHYLTEDQISNLNDLRRSGLSLAKIAKIIGCSRSTVSYNLEPDLHTNPIKYKQTVDERRARNVISNANWRREKKQLLVDYKGGKCENCGYSKCIEALEFHHTDPSTKEFAVGSMRYSYSTLKKEVDKCMLLCANCHREIHAV
jgi:AraC-like DNA-binding protein